MISEGKTGEDDPHQKPMQSSSATSTRAKELPTNILPEEPVQREKGKSGRWHLLNNSHTKKQESSSRQLSNALLLLSNPSPDLSGTRTLDQLATSSLRHIHPDIVDVVGKSEKEVVKNQSLSMTEVATVRNGVLQ